MTPVVLILLGWALSGQVAWLRMGKAHWSWFVSWKSRLLLALLLVTLALMIALMGPFSYWIFQKKFDLLKDDEANND